MSTPETIRQIADFHSTLWGDHFLHCDSEFKILDTTTQKQYEELKQEVKKMITDNADKPAQQLELIDIVQRLGVAYHFEREIEDELEKIHRRYAIDNNDDLNTVSLFFRLLRQQGIKISCNVFEKFKDDEGKFKQSLFCDVRGMLSLYEATFLSIRGEDILDEAMSFTTTYLKSITSSHIISSYLAGKIKHALNSPFRKSIPRLDARYFLSIYFKDDSHNETLLKFAKLDFNILQAKHQKELSAFTKWWKDLDFTTKLPYARDRLVELCFWMIGVYFEPQYEFGRKVMVKIICIISVIDDTFDAYGTLDELKLFTEAVRRWNVDAMDMLPEYMKILYKALLDVYSEVEEELANEGRSYRIHYAKKEMKRIVEAYFAEAEWFNNDYVPTMEEYMVVALVSAGYPKLMTASFLGMGDVANKESFEWATATNKPKIIRAAATLARLMDDKASHEFEQKRGHVASAVECYMKQHNVSREVVTKVFSKEVENAWKDINEELLKPTVVSMPLLERVLNLARSADFIYKDGDFYTNSYLMKDHVASLLRDPILL